MNLCAAGMFNTIQSVCSSQSFGWFFQNPGLQPSPGLHSNVTSQVLVHPHSLVPSNVSVALPVPAVYVINSVPWPPVITQPDPVKVQTILVYPLGPVYVLPVEPQFGNGSGADNVHVELSSVHVNVLVQLKSNYSLLQYT
jgi:hypothetical protein